jgi:hypothetical protein
MQTPVRARIDFQALQIGRGLAGTDRFSHHAEDEPLGGGRRLGLGWTTQIEPTYAGRSDGCYLPAERPGLLLEQRWPDGGCGGGTATDRIFQRKEAASFPSGLR